MRKSLLSLAVVTALASTSLLAGDVRVSGFVNVVGGMNDMDDGQRDNINGYDDQYDFQQNSLAALQFNGSISDNMSAVVQLVAQKSDTGDDIRMEWGYVAYDATDSLRILAGRVRPALFLYSDYLDVGYAYTWITPPSEVYYQAQITNLDGTNIAYNLELGDNELTFNAYAGNTTTQKIKPDDGTINDFANDNIFGGEIAFITEYMKIRAGYTSASVTQDGANFGPLSQAVVDELGFDESSAAFYGAGMSVDYEDFHFAAEYVARDMDETVAPDVTSYYAMLGYTIGDFTPNYTYAVADSEMEFSTAAGTTTAPDGKGGVVTKPNAAVINGMRAGLLDDRVSSTIGLRYEVNPAAALKFEYNMATVTSSTYGGGTTLNETDTDINTYRVALNVIF